jgi:hypothetical protein
MSWSGGTIVDWLQGVCLAVWGACSTLSVPSCQGDYGWVLICALTSPHYPR